MYRDFSFEITKQQYDYLLPVFGIIATNKLLSIIDRKIEKYFFIGTTDEYLDMINRCKYIN